jgi:hypothetical protein
MNFSNTWHAALLSTLAVVAVAAVAPASAEAPAASASAQPPAAPAATDARAMRLWAQTREALGGPALDRRPILRLDGTVVQGGLSGTATQWEEIGGRRFAESYVTEPLAGGDGYDGKVVWNRDGSGLVWVDGGEAGRAQEIGGAFAGNDTLWTQGRGGATIAWGGPKTDKATTFDSFVVTVPGAAVPLEVWFDRTTHLPVRWVQTIGPITSFSTYGDYRRVAGIMVPYRGHSENSGNTVDATVTHVTVNPADGSEKLAKPASNVRDFSIAGGAEQTTLPFDLVENHVYLNVMLNGKGPYRFIFDTGGANIVDPEVAKEIGAAGKGSLQGGGVGAATESFSFANVDALSIGTATVKNQLFAVAPVRAGFGVSGGRPVDGLIGFEVLARFITTFDYARGTVTLALPGSESPAAGAEVIPFVLDGRQPQFPCTIDAVASQCTLDTGDRGSLSLYAPFIAANPQIVPHALTAEGVNGFGFGGPAMGKLGRLDSVGIGMFDMPGLVADLTTQTQGAFAQPFLAANVGGGLLKRFTLFLDYGTGTMALTPNASYGTRDGYERAGLFLLNKNGQKIVYDVRPGTPAESAGILKGDTLATVDGKDASAMSLDDVRRMFFEAPGTTLHLGLTAKNGTTRNATLVLKDFV